MVVVLIIIGIILLIGGILNIKNAETKGMVTNYSATTWRATGIFCVLAAVFVIGIGIYIIFL